MFKTHCLVPCKPTPRTIPTNLHTTPCPNRLIKLQPVARGIACPLPLRGSFLFNRQGLCLYNPRFPRTLALLRPYRILLRRRATTPLNFSQRTHHPLPRHQCQQTICRHRIQEPSFNNLSPPLNPSDILRTLYRSQRQPHLSNTYHRLNPPYLLPCRQIQHFHKRIRIIQQPHQYPMITSYLTLLLLP